MLPVTARRVGASRRRDVHTAGTGNYESGIFDKGFTMNYTSDQQLRALGLRPLADIPNRAGVRVILRTRDSRDVPCKTYRATEGCHYCDYDALAFKWSDFIGWRPA